MQNKYIIIVFSLILVTLGIIAFFDMALAAGLLIIVFLGAVTLLAFFRLGLKNREIYWLFLIVFVIHLLAVIFIYYYHFYPFGGGEGDQRLYNQIAVELSERFRHGDFSVKWFDKLLPKFYVAHTYPILVGIVYALTMPALIIGMLLNVWFSALAAIFLYLLIIEIGGTRRNAFLIGFISGIWPSYLYASSLLLREAISLLFCFISLLFIVKIMKKFSWLKFFIFFITAGVLVSLRFYLGYSVILTFIVFWFFTKFSLNKKIVYGMVFMILFGFLPILFAGQGYYGVNSFEKFFNPYAITFIRETYYSSPVYNNLNQTSPPPSEEEIKKISSIDFSNPFLFLKNCLVSFILIVFGPFPWEVKIARHLLIFIEIIPWYFLLFFIYKGIKSRRDYRYILPLVFFSVALFLVFSVFLNDNFGTYMRLRMPAYMTLLALADFSSLRLPILNFLKLQDK